uniref:cleavage and polyadenylation specificity factor subunit 1-like n=1 Tax=Lonchura striata TaxID=40157 RepID=UPI0012934276
VQEGVRITLDCAQATFISYDKMVISLKGGEIYVLTLITDGMRSVRSFHFDKAAASVLTTCMVPLEPGYLFLGSRLGNSLLLRYTEKLQEPPAGAGKEGPDRQEEPPVKKKRSEPSGPWAGGKPQAQDEVDEIEVYGSEAASGTQLATYSFEVCDSILNIGPCANAAMGEPAFLSEEVRPQNGPKMTQLHFVPVDLGSPIVHCAVADPFGVLLSADGHLATFTLKGDTYGGRAPRLALLRPPVAHSSRVTALCLYRDLSGMSPVSPLEPPPRPHAEAETLIQDLSGSVDDEEEMLGSVDDEEEMLGSVDDEEEMLYGDSGGSGRSPPREEPRRAGPPEREPAPLRPEPSHWCVLARENGHMEIYQVPEWRLVFLVKNFPVGQRVLVDSSFGQPAAEPRKDERGERELPHVRELLLVGLGRAQSRPFLLDLGGFSGLPGRIWGSLSPASAQVPHGINFREKKPRPSRKKPEGPAAGGAPGGTPEEPGGPRGRVARFRPFHDIYGYSGVFICGPSPHWVLLTGRGALRLHPMGIDGPVESFAPFHNVNCPKGFLYFNRQGELRISVLPAYLSYDAPWPVRKIPLRCTAHYVAYHVESKVYAVATSSPHPCTRIPRMTGEEKEFESIERAVSDRDRNLLVYMYLPEAKESFGGLRLLRRADFHVGAHVNTFWRTPCRGHAEGPNRRSSTWENKHITWFATLDGGLGLLLPMQEKTYRRLLMLQNALSSALPHLAGLNPRAFRLLQSERRLLQNAVRNVLDGELLARFLYLSAMERGELAKKIGTTPDIILDDLLEIDRVTAHF